MVRLLPYQRFLVALMAVIACSRPTSQLYSGFNSFETPQTYFSTMTSLNVEVVYETGAEPYTGNGYAQQPIWNFLKTNLAALFNGRAIVPTVTVPTALSGMKSIPVQNKNAWTTDELLALGSIQRSGTSTETTGNFVVLFLNGYLDDGKGNPSTDVIGVQVTGSSVIAIFKPVITTAAGQFAFVGKYIEQSTLVHEMGHALGLVNNGIPMTSAHQETAHGAHCTNTSCTLYWQNEGASSALKFVQQVIKTGNEIIYGSECLNDARSYKP